MKEISTTLLIISIISLLAGCILKDNKKHVLALILFTIAEYSFALAFVCFSLSLLE